jgi:CubicO group peptidase (beta-lactamase class C family)
MGYVVGLLVWLCLLAGMADAGNSPQTKRFVEAGRAPLALHAADPIFLSDRDRAFLERSRARGLIVLKNGAIRYENYWRGAGPATRFASMSLAKSITSVLVGAAIRDGTIASIDDVAGRYVPELRGTGYGAVPISALLSMSSGIEFDTVPGSFSDAVAFWEATAIRHDERQLDWAMRLSRSVPPGQRFKYSGVDTAVLGLIVSRATGKTLSEYLSAKVWRQMGAEDGASWGLDVEGIAGQELAYCCIEARLRDLARFGHFLLDNGRGQIAAGWMRLSTRAVRLELAPGTLFPGYLKGYGFQWWLASEPGVYLGHGAHGQFLYIDPASRLVIVLTSDWPLAWDYEMEDDADMMFRRIGDAVK